ncbi:uncharacterized protein [Apostichopus japonicus]|uniref:uncharacterized protein n=1 Tax=Stichopus japonicus TaxID=307972 RepID=UPI003AB6D0DF
MIRLQRVKNRKVQTKMKSKKKKRASISRGTETDFEKVEEPKKSEEISLNDSFGIWMGENTSTPQKKCLSADSPVWFTHSQIKINDHSAHSIVLFEEPTSSPDSKPTLDSAPNQRKQNSSPTESSTESTVSPIRGSVDPQKLNFSPVGQEIDESGTLLFYPSGKVYFRKGNDEAVNREMETSCPTNETDCTISPSELDKTRPILEPVSFMTDPEIGKPDLKLEFVDEDIGEAETDGQIESEIRNGSASHEATVKGVPPGTSLTGVRLGRDDFTKQGNQNLHCNYENIGKVKTSDHQNKAPLKTSSVANTDKGNNLSKGHRIVERRKWENNGIIDYNWAEDKENMSPLIPRQRRSRKGIALKVDDVIKNFNDAMDDLKDTRQDINVRAYSVHESMTEKNSGSALPVHETKLYSPFPSLSTDIADTKKLHERGDRTMQLRDVTNKLVRGQYKAPSQVQFRSPSAVRSRTLPTGRNWSNVPDKHIYCNLPSMMFPCLSQQDTRSKDTSTFQSEHFPENVIFNNRLDEIKDCGEVRRRDCKTVAHHESTASGSQLGARQVDMNENFVARGDVNRTPEELIKPANSNIQAHHQSNSVPYTNSNGYAHAQTVRISSNETATHAPDRPKIFAPPYGTPSSVAPQGKKHDCRDQIEHTVDAASKQYRQISLHKKVPIESVLYTTETLSSDTRTAPSRHLDRETDKHRGNSLSEFESKITQKQTTAKERSSITCPDRSEERLIKTAVGKKVPKLLEFFETHSTSPRTTRPKSQRSLVSSVQSSVSDRINELETKTLIASSNQQNSVRRSLSGKPSEENDRIPSASRENVTNHRFRRSLPTSLSSRTIPDQFTNMVTTDIDRGGRSSKGRRSDTFYYFEEKKKKNFQAAENGRVPRMQLQGKRPAKEAILLCDYQPDVAGKKKVVSFQRGEVVQILSNWFAGQVRVRKYPNKTEATLPRNCLFFISGGVSIIERNDFDRSTKDTGNKNENRFTDMKRRHSNGGYLLEPYLVVQPHIAGGVDEVTILRGEVVIMNCKQTDSKNSDWARVYVPRTQSFGLVPLSVTQPLSFEPDPT